jgi:FAD/FMN-containing dehydrogenase
MNKIAKYLNEHIKGEVDSRASVRKAFSTDASLLTLIPDMVIYPRNTVDIRKTARFAWRLAETGHTFSLTARGGGSDTTGAAIGKNVIISTPAHMNEIFELDARQRLVRLQPGVRVKALNDALKLYGLMLPAQSTSAPYSTMGGAIANNASGMQSGKYGDMREWTHQLEVVLANGDLIQTERISKKELSRRKGLQTFEGDLYRKVDNLIADNQDLIEGKIVSEVRDNVGYSGIADVKRRDGSFDLTPLFVGSQGTLGIISEMIMRLEYVSSRKHVVVATLSTLEAARDCIEAIAALEPSILELVDGSIFEQAESQGKKYAIFDEIRGVDTNGAVIFASFDEANDRARSRKVKRAAKLAVQFGATVTTADEQDADELLSLREVTAVTAAPQAADASAPPLLDGVHVPMIRFEDFVSAIKKLEKKYDVELPLFGHAQEEIFHAQPIFHLKKVSDRQKVLKLIDEYSDVVSSHGGHLIAMNGEGRLKANAAYKHLDSDVLKLFEQIREIFDPHNFLNPGVKQPQDIRQLVKMLRNEYDTLALKDYTQYR